MLGMSVLSCKIFLIVSWNFPAGFQPNFFMMFGNIDIAPKRLSATWTWHRSDCLQHGHGIEATVCNNKAFHTG